MSMDQGSVNGPFPARTLVERLTHLNKSGLSVYLPAQLRTGAAPEQANPNGDASPTKAVLPTSPPAAGAGEPCTTDETTARGVEVLSLSDSVPRSSSVLGSVWSLSCDPQGCREVQEAMQAASCGERAKLAQELRGHVGAALRSPHANHVLQLVIISLPPCGFQFCIDELMRESVKHAAQHKFGCRVIQRLVEHGSEAQLVDLVKVLVASTSSLSRHPYGNYVVQHLLAHCTSQQRAQIYALMEKDVATLCKDLFGSAVVRTALSSGTRDEQVSLAKAIFNTPGLVMEMARMRHGHAATRSVFNILGTPDRKASTQVSEGKSVPAQAARCKMFSAADADLYAPASTLEKVTTSEGLLSAGITGGA